MAATSHVPDFPCSQLSQVLEVVGCRGRVFEERCWHYFSLFTFFYFGLYWGCFRHLRCGGVMVSVRFTVYSFITSQTTTNITLQQHFIIFSGDESNGEPSTSRTDVQDETDFSMASLAKREVTQVCVNYLPGFS